MTDLALSWHRGPRSWSQRAGKDQSPTTATHLLYLPGWLPGKSCVPLISSSSPAEVPCERQGLVTSQTRAPPRPALAPSQLTRAGQRGWGGKLRGVGAKRECRTFAQKQEKSPADDAKMGSFSPPSCCLFASGFYLLCVLPGKGNLESSISSMNFMLI